MYLFDKGEQEDLTNDQKKVIRKALDNLKETRHESSHQSSHQKD
jgi:hypothetical protein